MADQPGQTPPGAPTSGGTQQPAAQPPGTAGGGDAPFTFSLNHTSQVNYAELDATYSAKPDLSALRLGQLDFCSDATLMAIRYNGGHTSPLASLFATLSKPIAGKHDGDHQFYLTGLTGAAFNHNDSVAGYPNDALSHREGLAGIVDAKLPTHLHLTGDVFGGFNNLHAYKEAAGKMEAKLPEFRHKIGNSTVGFFENTIDISGVANSFGTGYELLGCTTVADISKIGHVIAGYGEQHGVRPLATSHDVPPFPGVTITVQRSFGKKK